MQSREDQLNDWGFFFRVQPDRNTATIVFNADLAIGMKGDFDFLSMTRQRFVGCVV